MHGLLDFGDRPGNGLAVTSNMPTSAGLAEGENDQGLLPLR